MKADYLDTSYKYVKLSSLLFIVFFLISFVVKPSITQVKIPFVVMLEALALVIPILISGIISTIGLIYAIKGSQYGQRNAKKRFFGLFGNFLFVFIIIIVIVDSVKNIKF